MITHVQTFKFSWKKEFYSLVTLKLILRSEWYPARLGCNFVLKWGVLFVTRSIPLAVWSYLVLYLFRVVRTIAWYLVLNGDLILRAVWSRTGKRTDSVPGIIRIFFHVFVNFVTPLTSVNFYKITKPYVEDLYFFFLNIQFRIRGELLYLDHLCNRQTSLEHFLGRHDC